MGDPLLCSGAAGLPGLPWAAPGCPAERLAVPAPRRAGPGWLQRAARRCRARSAGSGRCGSALAASCSSGAPGPVAPGAAGRLDAWRLPGDRVARWGAPLGASVYVSC